MESSQSGRVSAGCWWHFCRNKASCLFQVCLKRVCIATGVYSRVRSCQYSWNTWVILDCDYKQFFFTAPCESVEQETKSSLRKVLPCAGRHQAAFCQSFLVVPSNTFVKHTFVNGVPFNTTWARKRMHRPCIVSLDIQNIESWGKVGHRILI